MTRRGWILFVGLSLMWGIPYMLIKVALRELDPATIVFLRTAPAALVLLPWAAARGQLGSLRGRLPWLLAFTVCEFGVPWLLMSAAEERISSSLTALLIAGVPLLAALAYRFSHHDERLGPRRSAGLLLGTLGVGLLVGFSASGSTAASLLMMLVVVAGYTTGPIIIANRLAEVPGTAVLGVGLALVAGAYAPWGATHVPGHLSGSVIIAVAALAVVCTLGAFLTFYALVVEVGPPRATVVTYVNPAVAVLVGLTVLGEPLTTAMAVGFPLVILGSVLATSRPRGAMASAQGGAEAPG